MCTSIHIQYHILAIATSMHLADNEELPYSTALDLCASVWSIMHGHVLQ